MNQIATILIKMLQKTLPKTEAATAQKTKLLENTATENRNTMRRDCLGSPFLHTRKMITAYNKEKGDFSMEQIRLISVRELDRYVNRYPDVLIIDVRSKEEYRISHIRYAQNIPYEEGIRWNFPGNREILVYCERGSTSMIAAREIQKQGYRVVSLAGGISEYRGRNLVFSR